MTADKISQLGRTASAPAPNTAVRFGSIPARRLFHPFGAHLRASVRYAPNRYDAPCPASRWCRSLEESVLSGGLFHFLGRHGPRPVEREREPREYHKVGVKLDAFQASDALVRSSDGLALCDYVQREVLPPHLRMKQAPSRRIPPPEGGCRLDDDLRRVSRRPACNVIAGLGRRGNPRMRYAGRKPAWLQGFQPRIACVIQPIRWPPLEAVAEIDLPERRPA